MPFPIQTPLIGQALQRFFRIQGRVDPQLETSIYGYVQLGDLSRGQTPPVIRSATAFFDQAAVAAQRFVMQMRVPMGTLVNIKRLQFNPVNVSPNMNVGFGDTFAVTPTNAVTSSFADGRVLDLGQAPAAVILTDTQVATLATAHWQTLLTQNVPNFIDVDGWLVGSTDQDGTGVIEFSSASVNGRVIGTLEWDEFQIF